MASIPSLTEINNNLQQIARSILQLLNALQGSFISLAGTNVFMGANTFKLPPVVNAGAVGSASFEPEGALSNQFSVAGIGNGADTTDDILFSYTLPPNSLDAAGRALIIDAFGDFAANTHNKTVKIFFGASLVFTSGVQTGNGVGWWARLLVTKTGASAQIGVGTGAAGTTVFAVPLALIGSEVDTSAIVIKVTGASPTTGAAADVLGHGMLTRFIN